MNQFIKIQQIADDISQHPLLRDIPFERIVNYVFEVIRAIGCPKLFLDKTAPIEIVNYRGQLPCDFIKIIQVRGLHGEEYVGATNSFHVSPNKPIGHDECPIISEHFHKVQNAEDPDVLDVTKGVKIMHPEVSYGTRTYKIQGNVIITSEMNEPIEIAYTSLAMDEDGFPLIPNEVMFTRAVKAYIKYKWFEILFDMNQVGQAQFANAMKDYYLAAAQAQSALVMPTVDEMESLTSMWCTLLPRVREHKNAFATAHNRELIKQH